MRNPIFALRPGLRNLWGKFHQGRGVVPGGCVRVRQEWEWSGLILGRDISVAAGLPQSTGNLAHMPPEATLQIELVPFCFPRIFCFGFYFSALGSIILAYKQ